MDNACPRCGSKKVIPDLPVLLDVSTAQGPAGGSAGLRVEGAPEAWFFKDSAWGPLTAKACGECGHVELRAANSRLLYEKYESVLQRRGGQGEKPP
jgi:predicted RNA-binding Zn-ribbon protein involved in translation (DUF1610 family)